jgi:hypothetical protein
VVVGRRVIEALLNDIIRMKERFRRLGDFASSWRAGRTTAVLAPAFGFCVAPMCGA